MSSSLSSAGIISIHKSWDFLQAAEEGNLRLVETLSADPEVDLNLYNMDQETAFYLACRNNHMDVVRYLLHFHDNGRGRLDPNLVNVFGNTPLSIACLTGREEVVEMLVQDPRIDVNMADNGGHTPLWGATGYVPRVGIIKRLLASQGEIDTWKQPDDWHMKAAPGEIARRRGKSPRKRGESEEEVQQRQKDYREIASLIGGYQKDAEGSRRHLRRELGWDDRLAGELFALVVYLTDGYLTIRQEKHGRNEQRFLSIATQLPMDLQMVLCNRMFGVSLSIVKRVHSEKGFKKFVQEF